MPPTHARPPEANSVVLVDFLPLGSNVLDEILHSSWKSLTGCERKGALLTQ